MSTPTARPPENATTLPRPQPDSPPPRRSRLKTLLPLIGITIAAIAVTIVFRRIESLDFGQLLAHAGDYSPLRIAAALALVFFSLTLAGLYETAMLAELGSPIRFGRGLLHALIANPIGHTVGFSTLSAGALRYRLYSPLGLSNQRIAAIIVLSAFPYVLGIGLLLDLALVVGARQAAPALHVPIALIVVLGIVGLCKDLGYVVLTRVRKSPFRLGSLQIRLPTTGFTLLQFAVGVIQILCIADVIYILMPPELGMGFAGFLIVYLIALAAGSLSNVPAGLGVVEALLLVMLPQVPPEKLLAAVLTYRLVYEVIPVLVALALLASFELGSRHGIAGRLWRR
jgi:uncharacterized membrane protein YbhN (UPF0104 family)